MSAAARRSGGRHALLLLFALVAVSCLSAVLAASPAIGGASGDDDRREATTTAAADVVDKKQTTTDPETELEYQKRNHHHNQHRLVNPTSCWWQPPAIPGANAFACQLPVRSYTRCTTECPNGFTGSPSAVCVKGTWITSGNCTANAPTVLTFDAISAFNSPPAGYGGVNWSNFLAVSAGCALGGYSTGIKSSPMTVFNGAENPADMNAIAGTTFTVASVWATAAWLDSLTLTVTGYNGVAQTGQLTFTLQTTGPILIDLSSLTGVTKLTFATSGGTCGTACNTCGGNGRQFVFDNMAIPVVVT